MTHFPSSPVTVDAVEQYKNDWRRAVVDAFNSNVHTNQLDRLMELAELNGLFDPIRAAQCSAGTAHKITLEGWNIVDDDERRTIAKFEIWNGSKEELQAIIDRANGVAQGSWLPEVQFLLDRLEEFDPGDDEPEREFHGHVAPAIARLKSALSSTQSAAPSPVQEAFAYIASDAKALAGATTRAQALNIIQNWLAMTSTEHQTP